MRSINVEFGTPLPGSQPPVSAFIQGPRRVFCEPIFNPPWFWPGLACSSLSRIGTPSTTVHFALLCFKQPGPGIDTTRRNLPCALPYRRRGQSLGFPSKIISCGKPNSLYCVLKSLRGPPWQAPFPRLASLLCAYFSCRLSRCVSDLAAGVDAEEGLSTNRFVPRTWTQQGSSPTQLQLLPAFPALIHPTVSQLSLFLILNPRICPLVGTSWSVLQCL